jgi:protein-disulfide isomerase
MTLLSALQTKIRGLRMMKVGKSELLLVLIGITLVLSIANIYMNVSLGSKIDSIQAAAPAAANPTTDGNAAAPTVSFEATDAVMGKNNAPITIIEFSDFECPYCAAAVGANESDGYKYLKQRDPTWEAPMPSLIKNYIDTGKVKLVFRYFPLSSIHPDAEKAAEAAACANEQGKFWQMHDRLFANQKALDVASLKQYAKDLGLDTTKFNSCLDTGKMSAEVAKDLSDGQSYGVQGTPAFFVDGQLLSGAQPYATFKSLIDQRLAAAK